ncbi:MAG: hypothetical protein AAGA60_26655 [Cyanobacteria bacterium P01_E01_bin.42]
MSFDPRSYSSPVYTALFQLRKQYDGAVKDGKINVDEYKKHLQEQKSQAQELYSYLSTWGLLRLKGEELSLNKWHGQNPEEIDIEKRAVKSQEGRREIVEQFFQCLDTISKKRDLAGKDGIQTLTQQQTKIEDYLGLTGIALEVAKEFSFWANTVYYDIKAGANNDA